jgi:hypothetical protein
LKIGGLEQGERSPTRSENYMDGQDKQDKEAP